MSLLCLPPVEYKKEEKKIKDIKVNIKICYESKPCQHDVILYYHDGTKIKKRMCAPDIVKILTKLGKHVPSHFKIN